MCPEIGLGCSRSSGKKEACQVLAQHGNTIAENIDVAGVQTEEAGSCTEPCVDVKAHSALKPLLIPSRLNPTPYTETLPPNGGDYNTFPDAISWEANGDDMDGGRRCMHVWLYRCGPLHSGIHTLASVRPDRKASPDPSDLQQTPCISSDFLTDNQHRAFHHTFRPTTNTPSYDPHPAFPDPSTFLAPPPKTAPAMHCGV